MSGAIYSGELEINLGKTFPMKMLEIALHCEEFLNRTFTFKHLAAIQKLLFICWAVLCPKYYMFVLCCHEPFKSPFKYFLSFCSLLQYNSSEELIQPYVVIDDFLSIEAPKLCI